MAKTTSQIYTDVNAIDVSDQGQSTTNNLLMETAFAMANLATALESINSTLGGPTNPVTAATLYAQVEALDSADSGKVMDNFYMKEIGLLSAKLAMEAESIQASFGPQVKTAEISTSLTLTPTIDIDAQEEHIKTAGMVLGASIDIDSKQALVKGASLSVGAQLYQAVVS